MDLGVPHFQRNPYGEMSWKFKQKRSSQWRFQTHQNHGSMIIFYGYNML